VQKLAPLDLPRLLTLAENGDLTAALAGLTEAPGRAHRIGITGPPGAGKSTLTGALIKYWRNQGRTVAVVAVDPSSPRTGGALLGDRIRMENVALDPGVFIRSMATRGALGGLARGTRAVSDVLDAAGFDLVIVETVGVGQTELDVVSATDTTVLVLVPESGDGIQALKSGLMEVADVFAVNKSDRPGAERMVGDIRTALALADHGGHPSRDASPGSWVPPVVSTVATSGQGVEDLAREIDRHRGVRQPLAS
jgi:LAO/AO transport system kinase